MSSGIQEQNELERTISLKRAMFYLAGVLGVVIILGFITGYLFFWNQFQEVTENELWLRSAQRRVDENPKSVEAMVELGYVYLQQGKPDEAVKWYQKAYKIDKYSHLVRYHLGMGYMAKEEFVTAIKYLKPVADEGVVDFDAQYSLGEAYYRAGSYEEAVKTLGKALVIRPGAADAHYLTGLSYEGLGKPEKALQSLDKALKMVPDYDEARQARERIAAGQQASAGGAKE